MPEDHFALTSADFEVLPGRPGEHPTPSDPDFESWTASELLAYASEQGIDVGKASSSVTLARRIRAAVEAR